MGNHECLSHIITAIENGECSSESVTYHGLLDHSTITSGVYDAVYGGGYPLVFWSKCNLKFSTSGSAIIAASSENSICPLHTALSCYEQRLMSDAIELLADKDTRCERNAGPAVDHPQ